MFMRFRGGAVGHKTTREETKYLLDDRDELDKVAFEREYERAGYAKQESDVEMGSGDSDDGEDVMEEDENEQGGGSDLEEDESDVEEYESDGGDIADGLGLSGALADDELLDKMEDFLNEVVEEDEETAYLGEDDLGAEDGENVDWDELEPLAYL